MSEQHLNTRIDIVVDGEIVGQIQSLTIEEREKTAEKGPGGMGNNFRIKAGRIRFDRNRIAESFNRGYVSAMSQCRPMQIVIRDKFITGYSIDTTLENCWIGKLGYAFTASDYIIVDTADLSAENVFSKMAEDERTLQRIKDNLESGSYKTLSKNEKRSLGVDEDAVVIRKGRAVGPTTEVGADAINDVREAIFEIEEELGIGSNKNPIAERLDDAIKPNGEIKASIMGVDIGVGESKTTTTMVSPNGVTCKKCNEFNEFCTSPSETDGTHICYRCRSGF